MKNEPTLTLWYPDNVRPARAGVYMRQFIHGNRFSAWDGTAWHLSNKLVEKAAKTKEVSVLQNLPWRGFTEKQT